jgi:hypothetical protein
MVIEVLTEVAHGASSVMHRDPERLALRDPLPCWGVTVLHPPVGPLACTAAGRVRRRRSGL